MHVTQSPALPLSYAGICRVVLILRKGLAALRYIVRKVWKKAIVL